MIIVISPAKSLDFESPLPTQKFSQPAYLEQSQELIEQLQELAPQDIASLMKLSDKLATLNYNRFQDFKRPFNTDNARPAVLAFTGDVYQGLDANSFNEDDFNFAQNHLRILSGLYGLLKPLDLIQPYRLEMGTKFENTRGKNLYEFWGDAINDEINQTLDTKNNPVLVNLASNEYFKAAKEKQVNHRVVTPVFKDRKNGEYKIISFFAKKARGLMTRYIIENRITAVEGLKDFNVDGYYFSKKQSSENQWVFLRDSVDQ